MSAAEPTKRPPRTLSPIVWPIIALAALLIFNAFKNPQFFHLVLQGNALSGTLIDILRRSSPQMLLAMGMTLVIATYGIDLSVGSIVAISGTLAAYLVTMQPHPYSFALAMLLTLVASLVAGLWNGVLVAYIGIQPIIATLILMVAGRGIAKLLSAGQQVPFENVAPYVFLTNGTFLYLPFCVTIVLVFFGCTWLLTRRTAIGMMIEAVGNNERASRFCGINARLVKLLAYGFSGFAAGLAGMLTASDTHIADPANIGKWMELDAIFAVVVGGTSLAGGRFSLVGSLIGAILLVTLTQTMYWLGMPPDVAPVPKSIVIVGVCLLQSPKFRRWVTSFFRSHAS